ncbi:MAG: hypothetical protein OXH63_22085 [Gemmatimonadetes bacterium]|nr:hypothetical protein [Gemmatimonadota bacterium]
MKAQLIITIATSVALCLLTGMEWWQIATAAGLGLLIGAASSAPTQRRR